MAAIIAATTRDVRVPLPPGAGVDAVHSQPVYSFAVTRLRADTGEVGTGLALTLGAGNDLVCRAAESLAAELVGIDIETLMAEFGARQRKLADHPQWRWLGPHKGVVHLALASVTNACFDLWALKRGVPLWKLLLDLTPEEVLALLDLSYLEDVLPKERARELLRSGMEGRREREQVLRDGYPGYDTSVGWFGYADEELERHARRAVESGFTAMKLKIGSPDPSRDVRRVERVRRVVGPEVRLMVDANQAWNLPQALVAGRALRELNLFWFEEPSHPDDVAAHALLARELTGLPLAAGEHLPNRVVFKNYMQAQAMAYVQADALRLAGVAEFLTVSLLAAHFGLPVAPHVGDMGQLHQHLVLYNRIGLGLPLLMLEYIPHLREHFVTPAQVQDGVYRTPQEPGASCALHDATD